MTFSLETTPCEAGDWTVFLAVGGDLWISPFTKPTGDMGGGKGDGESTWLDIGLGDLTGVWDPQEFVTGLDPGGGSGLGEASGVLAWTSAETWLLSS